MTGPRLENLAVNDIELDRDNPRIRRILEMYPEPTPERIYMALGGDGPQSTQERGTTFEKLKNSILSSQGIIQPIIVNRVGDRLVCIEGNTRVAIYRSFIQDGYKGDWTTIPAMVHENLPETAMDAIRLQVHLVGPRAWDPYSKAKYLHHLRTQQLQPFDRIIDFCGGSKREVQEAIQAYSDMEKFYRPLSDEGNFDATRFSGFVEYQKPRVKESVMDHGFGPADFAKWMKEGKIDPLNTVRQIPAVLANPRAKTVFLSQGMKAAIAVLDRPDAGTELKQASLGQLARALRSAIGQLQYEEIKRLQDNPEDDTAVALFDALELLQGLVDDIRRDS